MTSVEPGLRAATDHAIDWLAEIDLRPVAASHTPPELRCRRDSPQLENPTDPVSLINDLVANVEGGLLGCASGRFYGWVIGGAHPAALAQFVVLAVLPWMPRRGPTESSPPAAGT